MKPVPYKRILLKLSGETLVGTQSYGINHDACKSLAHSIKTLQEQGLEIAIVIGGGNIFRGVNVNSNVMQRTPADHIGMLATLINGIALQQALETVGCPAKVMSALECPRVADTYNWAKAQEYLAEGKVILFVGGTGNPYFTTDTAAALRASEIHADILLKATKVDGVYDKDPLKYPEAKKFETISYVQYLAQKLEVMDATSIALCMKNKIPVLVFNMRWVEQREVLKVLAQPASGTLIKGD